MDLIQAQYSWYSFLAFPLKLVLTESLHVWRKMAKVPCFSSTYIVVACLHFMRLENWESVPTCACASFISTRDRGSEATERME